MATVTVYFNHAGPQVKWFEDTIKQCPASEGETIEALSQLMNSWLSDYCEYNTTVEFNRIPFISLQTVLINHINF